MLLNIGTRVESNVAVLTLQGALTLGPSLVSLRQAARQSLATPQLKGIILDVSGIVSVDSSGLGELTIVYSSASRHNCAMCLVGVSANLQKMLEMTHLDGVLNSAPQIEAAIRQVQLR